MNCAAIGLSVGIAISLAAPPGVDAPAHLFQTWAFTHFGFTIWNNYWYAGNYQFVTYSLLYYAAASMVGIFWVSVLACAVLGGAFASMTQRRFGNAGRGPATAFAVTDPAVMMVSGMYPFLAGSAFAVLTLVAAQRRSRLGFALAAAATACFSPLAFFVVVLCLLAAVGSTSIVPSKY